MDVIAFKSSVLQFFFDLQHSKDNPQVKVKLFQLCHSKRTFRMTMEKILPLGFSATELKLVTVKYLLNTLTGVFQPCMLLRQPQTNTSGQKETVIYHVLLFEGFESLFLLGSFEIERARNPANDMQLVEGPAVCWVFEDTVNFARYDSTVGNFKVDIVSIGISLNNTLGQFFTLLWCGILDMEVVSMGVKSEITDETRTALARWTCVNHSRGTIHEIPLVPDIYAAIGTSCLIRESSRVVKPECSNTVYDRLDVYLATIRGQLLKFVGGLLKNCWQLPFSDPHRIWMVEPELNEVVIIVQSRTRKVCAVNSRKKQVVKEWDGIETVLIDDFLQSGTDQVLFFPTGFAISETGEFSKFMLVDIARGMMSVENIQETTHVDSQQSDSLQRTARALRTQLQARTAAVNELKLECDAKLRMVEHSCKVVKGIVSSSSPTRKKMLEKLPGLFCLLEGAVDDGAELQKPETNLKSSLIVKETWQRVIFDQWVVGVDVENCDESPVSDLVLGLVNCQPEQVEYSSKPVLWGSNIRFHDEMKTSKKISPSVNTRSHNSSFPFLKRKKTSNAEAAENQQLLFPGSQRRLTVLSSVPTFKFQENYSTCVVLTWKSHDNNGRVACRAMHCGYVTLQTDQIINGSLQVNKHLDNKSIQQDIVALRSTSIETESDKSCVHRLIPLVKRTVGVPVLQTEGGSYDITGGVFDQLLATVCDDSPLAGAGIVMHSGLQEGRFTLIARNESQMYLVLHKLRQVLPDDVILLPDPTLERLAVQSGLSALNDEITTLQQGLYGVSQKTRHGVDTDVCNLEKRNQDIESKKFTIQSLREDYERKREREKVENDELASGQEELEELWNDLVRVQMATDHSVGKILNL